MIAMEFVHFRPKHKTLLTLLCINMVRCRLKLAQMSSCSSTHSKSSMQKRRRFEWKFTRLTNLTGWFVLHFDMKEARKQLRGGKVPVMHIRQNIQSGKRKIVQKLLDQRKNGKIHAKQYVYRCPRNQSKNINKMIICVAAHSQTQQIILKM